MSYEITPLAVLTRLRGDSRIKIEGMDFSGDPSFGKQPKRLRMAIQKPVSTDDEVAGRENWRGSDWHALRLQELDELIEALQRGRRYLTESM